MSTYVDGKNYGIPIMQPVTGSGFSDLWRVDMLEKAGITEIPTTIEEAEIAFEAIKNTDFGQGAGKTYAFTWRGADQAAAMFFTFFSAYGTFPDRWMIEEDGTIVNGRMRDGAKDALAKLADWYAKGYIDPEFITTTNAILKQKISTGSVAMIPGATWNRALPPSGEFLLDALSGDPDAVLLPGPALKGPDGQNGYSYGSVISSAVAFGVHLEKDEDKLNRCIELVNFLMADTGENEYVRYGTKDVDWVVDEVTGTRISLHTDPNEEAQFNFNPAVPIPPIPAFSKHYQNKLIPEYDKYSRDFTLQPEVDYNASIIFFVDPEINSTATIDADPIFNQGCFDIIIGARPVDDFDVLREQWYKSGGQELTDEYNRAYKEYDNIAAEIVSNIK